MLFLFGDLEDRVSYLLIVNLNSLCVADVESYFEDALTWWHVQKLLFKISPRINLFVYHSSLSKTESIISKLITSWATQCGCLSVNLIIAQGLKYDFAKLFASFPHNFFLYIFNLSFDFLVFRNNFKNCFCTQRVFRLTWSTICFFYLHQVCCLDNFKNLHYCSLK